MDSEKPTFFIQDKELAISNPKIQKGSYLGLR